jgi:hypothetical protein
MIVLREASRVSEKLETKKVGRYPAVADKRKKRHAAFWGTAFI